MVRIVLSTELAKWRSLLNGKKAPKSKREQSFVRVSKALLERKNSGELRSLGAPYFEPLQDDLNGFFSAYLREGGKNLIRLIMTIQEFDHETGKEIEPSLPDNEPLVFVIYQMIDEKHYKELKKRLKDGWKPEE